MKRILVGLLLGLTAIGVVCYGLFGGHQLSAPSPHTLAEPELSVAQSIAPQAAGSVTAALPTPVVVDAPALGQEPSDPQQHSTEQGAELPALTFLDLQSVYNDGSYNVNKIDSDLVEHGQMFLADLAQLKRLSIGAPVRLTLLNHELNGALQKKQDSQLLSNTQLRVGLGDQLHYLTAYYGETITRGKIYGPQGAYIYEHNGDVGFLLSLYEYKKLNNALVFD